MIEAAEDIDENYENECDDLESYTEELGGRLDGLKT
jgi:hypothetical protein